MREKFIRLDNNSYVNLNNATSFSIEKRKVPRERPCKKKILWFEFEDFELFWDETTVFIVDGEPVYETFTSNIEGMHKIENIKKIITSFIRK